MALPPKGVEPSALWVRFSERPRPTTTVELPGKAKDGQPVGAVKLRILTESELHTVRANAEKAAKGILGEAGPKGGETNFGYEDIYRNELYVELLALAARDPENEIFPWAPSARHLRQAATTDDIAVLYNAYNAFRIECGPIVSELSKEECEAWLKVLTEGASRVPFSRLNGEAATDLILYLGSKLRAASSTATGSPGSPPDEASMETAAPASELVDENEKTRDQD